MMDANACATNSLLYSPCRSPYGGPFSHSAQIAGTTTDNYSATTAATLHCIRWN